MLISSHLLDELARLASWYGFMDGGRILRQMSAQELEAACRKSTQITVLIRRSWLRCWIRWGWSIPCWKGTAPGCMAQ